MKFDVVVGNPVIAKQPDGQYMVAHATPPEWNIETYENLTRSDLEKIPFITKAMLDLLA